MLVSELVERLKEVRQDLLVVVKGYEGGADNLMAAEEINISLNTGKEWYYGRHKITSEGETKAIILR